MTHPSMTSALACVPGESLRAQVVVIGLGAGGSMAFHDLARAGIDVLAIELGSPLTAADATRREEQMMPRLFMEGGSRATRDMSIRVLQGKGVGGSTLHNTNLCKRLPAPLLERWARDYGLHELLEARFQQDFLEVEALLHVHRIPDEQVNTNNRLIARGVEQLGWRGGRLSHNRQGCKQSGFCELGCPNNGKQNAAKVLIPAALAAGGRVLTEARVERLVMRGGRIVCAQISAVEGYATRHTLEVHADHFVLGASATGSAALVRRSALPDPYRLAGRRLHMHPGAFVIGRFEEPVESWRGVPQSVDCTEFLSFEERDEAQRVWLVAGAAHPGGAASMMPGFGAEHAALMRRYPYASALIAMVHDHSSGQVSPGPNERVLIDYQLEREDWEQVALGLKRGAQIMLAAGAREVILPLSPGRRVTREQDVAALSARDLRPFNPPLVAVHPMSTLWMGRDAARAVVDPFGQHHQVKNLVVADGSLFPTSIGGPPQVPITTLARHVTRALLARV